MSMGEPGPAEQTVGLEMLLGGGDELDGNKLEPVTKGSARSKQYGRPIWEEN